MSRYEPTSQQYVFKDKRNGKLYFRGTIRGKFIDRALKTDKISLAKSRIEKLWESPDETPVKEAQTTFEEVFNYTLKIQRSKAKRTARQTEDQILLHLMPWFKENCPFISGKTKRYRDGFEKQYEEIWGDYVLEASGRKPPEYLKTEEKREAWLKENPEPRKLEHDRRYLLMALKRAKVRGWINTNFEEKHFSLLESSEPIGQYIEPENLNKILLSAKASPKAHLQILIAAQMGMRLREILHLRKSEISLSKMEIDLNPKRIKTRKRREVCIPISHDILPLLRQAYEDAPGDFIFPAWLTNKRGRPLDPTRPQNDNKHHWKRIKIETGIEVRFHDLRHTAITNMLKRGIPEYAVRKVCGVSEVTMRRIYAHMDTEMKRKIIDAFRGISVEFKNSGDHNNDSH